MRRIVFLLAVVAVCWVADSRAAPIVLSSSSGEVLGAVGVETNGALYNFTLVDGSCSGLFSGCDESAFAFTGEGAANAASRAIAETLGTSLPEDITGCSFGDLTCSIFTPWDSPNVFGRVTVSQARAFANGDAARFVGNSSVDQTLSTGGSSGHGSVYARWSPTLTGQHYTVPYLADCNDQGNGACRFEFDFNHQAGNLSFIDPDFAAGYEYEITSASSPLISAVMIPFAYGDGQFELYTEIGGVWSLATTLTTGVRFDLTNAVSRIRVLGIEDSAMVDPMDPLGFVTGLDFSASGPVAVAQTALLRSPGGGGATPVSGPHTFGLLAVLGLVLLRARAN